MASSFQKPTAEQVRAQYRQQFSAADLVIPVIVDALDADGLIHSSKLEAPLRLSIPGWDERAPELPPGRVNTLTIEWKPASSNEYLPFYTEDIPAPSLFPDANFPLARTIPRSIFQTYEGFFKVRFRVSNWNGGGERQSPEAQVEIDRTGPKWVDPPKAVIDIVEKPLITDAILNRDKGVFCIIPDFIEDKKADVLVHLALLDHVPVPEEDITDFIVLTRLMPADRKVLIPAHDIRRYGSVTQYVEALLIDKAGNPGARSLPATMHVALGTLPSNLLSCSVPLAADGLIDRADADFPTKVRIEEYTGWDEKHGMLVKWGNETLARTPVGAHLPFPLEITVGWSRMATGGHHKVTYSGQPHSFPGLANRKLPRVETSVRNPGGGQPAIETHYAYSNSGANFVGFGSGVTYTGDGLDTLNKDGVIRNYQYETTETLWDVPGNKAVRTTHRVFNRAHLLVLEEVTQISDDPQKSDTVHKTESKYYFDPNLDFKDQPPYCQLPESVTETWHYANATQPRHEEITTTTYDNWGNLLTQKNPNGMIEASEWYPAAGESDASGVLCPKDPQDFVRNLKSKTITPAPSPYGNAQTLKTAYRYTEQLGLTGQGPWLAIRDESLVRVVDKTQLQLTAYQYISKPGDPFEHGRKLQETVTLNGKTTTTDYAYGKTLIASNGETTLHTVNTLTGFDGEKKVIRMQHWLRNGVPLLQRDDTDVEILYEFDLLDRVTKETVAPGTAYEASRTYTYTLTNAAGQQATQTACNVKGVTTTTFLDGFNRVIEEARQDADAPGFNPQNPPRLIYKATFDNRMQMDSETLIDWEGAKDVPLTSQFKYDAWGQQRSVVRADGVEEFEETDPVRRTTTQWLEVTGKDVSGKTVTTTNLFNKPDSVKRFLKGVDPVAPGAQPYSDHIYGYDGIGRTAEETDAVGNKTTYDYDEFDRMVKTVLPDTNEVTREYAPHSREDLPITIQVNGVELGSQEFDGLDRMIVSTTGGRRSEYKFEPGQTQPKSVLRPSGVSTDYVYRPELGEDPEQRIAVESTAVYTYDPHNARLSTTQETDANNITHKLTREYFSTGELKSERRDQTGEPSRVMLYDYSRQARQLSYTDVLGQIQTYTYNAKAQMIQTRLGTTASTFTYDDLARVSTITTVDGTQTLITTLEYDDFGREVKRTFDLGGGVIQTLEQTYDEVDRLTHRVLQEGNTPLRDETYGYDERGRLEAYQCSGDQCPVDPYGKTIESQNFVFDAMDNITFMETGFKGGTHSISYEFKNQNDPCQLTGLTNKLVPADPSYPPRIDFSYNAVGSLTTDEAGRTLGYDSLGRLISVGDTSGGGTSKSYQYSALDILSGSGSGAGNEQRFYQGDDVATLIQGSDTSTFMRGDGVVLAEHQEGAGPKS